MKKFDVALRIKIGASNDWNRAKVRLFVDSIFDLVESPLGSIKAKVIEVSQLMLILA